jgi:hypothetical protein
MKSRHQLVPTLDLNLLVILDELGRSSKIGDVKLMVKKTRAMSSFSEFRVMYTQV